MTMLRRLLPGTDLELSRIGFGCWAIGKTWWGDDVDDGTSRDAICEALNLGVNWFDTAPLYGHGHSDKVLVEALGGSRHDVVIATKVGIRWDGDGKHAMSDLTSKHIVKDTEESLKRLGLECIPLLQVHWPCELQTPLEETMGALERLKEQGKVRHVGLCNYNSDGLASAESYGRVASLQTPYSIVRREFERDLMVRCEKRVGVIAYEVLCRGLLTGKYTQEPSFPDSDLRARDDRFKGGRFLRANVLVRRLEKIAKKLKVPTSALAIAWVLRKNAVTSALVGCTNRSQIQQNVRALEILEHRKLWPLMDQVVAAYIG
jgi:aryl-alcohol dehydrogenase-like predicted oxidoreductase